MKIGIVSNLYPPMARGGAEQIARRVAHELYRRGHDVFVISTTPYTGLRSLVGRVTERTVEAVYRYYPWNIYHLLNGHKYPFVVRAIWHLIDLWCPFPANAVRSVLRDEKPDVLLTHNLKGMGLQVAAEIRRMGIPSVHTLHDVQLSVPSGLLMFGAEQTWINRSVLRRWYETVVQVVVGSPRIVISPSKFLADFYWERGFFPQSRVEVISNPAPRIEPPPRVPPADGSPLRLLFAGQLEEHKGILLLLRALNASDIPFELHIAGEGSLADVVEGWAKRDRRITYHGFVSLEHLMRLLAVVDAALVPSLCYENSPTVIYEAFQAGVPVIASRIGGVGELVSDGVNGYLVTPGDERELVEAIRTFAVKRRDFFSRQGEIRAMMREHSLERYVDRLEQLIEAARG
jgi:glycosyltransferase involved in cell wall biosynthesis